MSNKGSMGANFKRYTITLPPELVEIITDGLGPKGFSQTIRQALIRSLTDEQLAAYKALIHSSADERFDILHRRIAPTRRAYQNINIEPKPTELQASYEPAAKRD